MIDNTALSLGPTSCWQLRAEFWVTSSHGDDRQLADQMTKTMQELDLEPRHLERIHKAVLEATQGASLRGYSAKPISPVHIRIWVGGECARVRNWGFFLVEKPGSELLGASARSEYLVELYLYQERNS